MVEIRAETEEASAEAYTLKEPTAHDVFLLVEVLNKIGFAEISAGLDKDLVREAKFNPPVKLEKGKHVPIPREQWTDAQNRAYDRAMIAGNRLTLQILDLALRHLPACESDLYALLASGTGRTAEEIREMDAVSFMRLLNDYIDRDWFPDFFTEAQRLLSGSRRPGVLPT